MLETDGRVQMRLTMTTVATGVEQNGDWIQCQLSDVCSAINYGLTASASGDPTGSKFLRITDIVSGDLNWDEVPFVPADASTHNKYRLYDGDIVIARTGASTGASAYIKNPPPSVFASYLVRLQTKPEFDPRFVAYYLKSEEFWGFIRGVLGDKSAQPNASASTMASAPFKAPRLLSEQKAIAHILSTLDDKIELNRRMNRTLEEMARAIFQDWFMDFGPTRAKIEGQEPYLPPELWDLFPGELVDSELGEIPEGWQVKPLNHLVALNPRETMKKGTNAPYIEMASLPVQGCRPENPIMRQFNSGSRFRNGDTLLARITPCLENGKTGYVQCLPDEAVGWGSTEFIVMRGIQPTSPQYTYLLARDQSFRSHAILSMTGTSGRQRVQTEALAAYLTPFPPADVHQALTFTVQPLFQKIEANRVEIDTLTMERNALLPRLVSGSLPIVSG